MRAKNLAIRRKYPHQNAKAPAETAPTPPKQQDELVAVLQRIDVTLARLVQAWESTPDKKKKFGIV